jgi:two-component system cell cycle response regulator DivK
MSASPWPRVRLRLAGRKSSGDSSSASKGGGAVRLDEGMGVSVLIVDDVEDTRELYERYFQFRGARVTTAADGEAALAMIGSQRPDVIVLDLAMPRMTGWEVIQRLKGDAQTRMIPIVVLSGQDARESALEAGADSYLEKPCLPDDLLAEVLRVLGDSTRRSDH